MRETHQGPFQLESYYVPVAFTPCNYGGKRAWLVCPKPGCGRRVATLYGYPIFTCRHCLELVYRTQREPPRDRALRRAQNIRERLGGTADMSKPFPLKPTGMHWRTYGRLLNRHYKAYREYIDGLGEFLRLSARPASTK